jgi:hypothetical protein
MDRVRMLAECQQWLSIQSDDQARRVLIVDDTMELSSMRKAYWQLCRNGAHL